MNAKGWSGPALALTVVLPISFAAASPRYPVDLALDPEGRWLFTANEGTGSVSLIDLALGEVIDELELDPAGRPCAVAIAGSRDALLIAVAERFRHRIAFLRVEMRARVAPQEVDGAHPDRDRSEPRLRLLRRAAVGRLPADLDFSPDGSRLWVACEGEGDVWELEAPSGRLLRRLEAVEGARRLAVVFGGTPEEDAGSRLVTAGRSEVTEIDLATGRRLAIRAPADGTAFNIDGLAVTGGKILLAHQVKPTEVAIEAPMIVWGLVIANRVTSFPLTSPVRESEDPAGTATASGVAAEGPRARVKHGTRVIPLDLRHRAAGDPTAIARVPAGATGDSSGETLVVLSGGTDRLLFVDLEGRRFEGYNELTASEGYPDLRVGDRPAALVVTAGGERAFVACYLDDTIVEVDLEERSVLGTVSLGGRSEVDKDHPAVPHELSTTLARRGAAIFHDADRSRGGWYSCHSCHPNGGTRGHRFDTLADGTGLAKKAPSLRGVTLTGPWSWLGRFETLEAQITSSLHHTMAVDEPPAPEDVESVAAFLGSLGFPDPSPPRNPSGDAGRGAELFHATGCAGCHEPPEYTTSTRRNAGVADDFDGTTRFNPPSLHGVRDDFRYLHDGRAKSLSAIFREHDPDHRHGSAHELSDADLRDLVAFLESL